MMLSLSPRDALRLFRDGVVSPRSRDALAAVGASVLAAATLRAALYLLRGGTVSAALNSATRAVVGGVIAAARAVPFAAAALDAELDHALDGLRDELAPPSPTSLLALPSRGRAVAAVISELTSSLESDAARNGLASGASFGGIYHVLNGPAASRLHTLHSAVAGMFLDSNALYPSLFRTSRRVEAEVISMCVTLLRDGVDGSCGGAAAPRACGLFTSGGTESVLLAVKAHRDAALTHLGFAAASGKDADTPPILAAARAGVILTVVAGVTVHPAFDKACALFGLRLVKVPVDPITLALTPSAVAATLDRYTLLIVASAPGFAHGVVDDIVGLGALASSFHHSVWGSGGVPLHVDNCLGGMHLSFLAQGEGGAVLSPPPQKDRQGGAQGGAHLAFLQRSRPAGVGGGGGGKEEEGNVTTPPRFLFDFRASPAVASISMDIHKYGGSPKGASVVCFRDPSRRRAAYSTTIDYPGGLYATPGLAGSRNGAPAALAWATLLAAGGDGLSLSASRTATAHALLARGICDTPALVLLGTPHACVVAFTTAPSAPFSIYSLSARMAASPSGWKLALLQAPRGAHVVVTERFAEAWTGGAAAASHVGVWTVAHQWLADLRAAIAAAIASPHDPAFEGVGDAAIYGAAGVLPSGEVGEVLRRYCDVLTVVR